MSVFNEPENLRFLIQDRRSSSNTSEFDLIRYADTNQLKSLFEKTPTFSECGSTGLDLHPEFSNAWLSIGPTGSGFISATTPNGTTGGGVCRGINAVDWQIARSDKDQVALGDYSVIGGGNANINLSTFGIIGGGLSNRIGSSVDSQTGGTGLVILGGNNNTLNFNNNSIIIAGCNNLINQNSDYSIINSGSNNIIQEYSNLSIILGGLCNSLGPTSANVILNGTNNYNSGYYNLLSNGYNNYIKGTSNFLAGGHNNTIKNSNYNTLIGGQSNVIIYNSEQINYNNSIVGGTKNSVSSQFSSIIFGGKSNIIKNSFSFISSGYDNTNSGVNSSILSGNNNLIETTGINNSSIIGGQFNIINGDYVTFTGHIPECANENIQVTGGAANNAVVLGGSSNIAAHNNSVVMGDDYQTNEDDSMNVGGSVWLRDVPDFGLTAEGPTSLFGAIECPTGVQGPMGELGPQGMQGFAGPTGPLGNTGVQGSPGPTGNVGATGQQGSQGPTGIQGSMGNVGPPGDQGPQGVQGNPGIQGDVGPPGVQGNQGPQGVQGNAGPTGPQGETGPVSEIQESPVGVFSHDSDPNPSFMAVTTWDQPFIFDPENQGNTRIKPTFGSNNSVNADNSSILAGENNSITSSSSNSTILGGLCNIVNNNTSTILGGTTNSIASYNSSIVSGRNNAITSTNYGNLILSGYNNTISTTTTNSSVIMGGHSNLLNSNSSIIFSGNKNEIDDNSINSNIAGGISNYIMDSNNSSILAGQFNRVDTSNTAIIGGNSNSSFGSTGFNLVIGIANNLNSCSGVIVSGNNNYIDIGINGSNNSLGCFGSNNVVRSGLTSIIGGNCNSCLNNVELVIGFRNRVENVNSIVTGSYNRAEAGNDDGFIIGGQCNYTASNNRSGIICGILNKVIVAYSVILGGKSNSISEGSNNFICSGTNNTISGAGSAILAGTSHSIFSDVSVGNSVIIGGSSVNIGTSMSRVSDIIFAGGCLFIDNVNQDNSEDNVLNWTSSTGEVRWQDETTITCDERFKTNITEIKHEEIDEFILEKIKLIKYQKLKPKEQTTDENKKDKTNSNEHQYYGFSAQNLESILPNIVYKTKYSDYDDEYLNFDFIGLLQYLTGVCSKQTSSIKKLQDEINILEKQIYS